jgi:Uma2 family endonuclease
MIPKEMAMEKLLETLVHSPQLPLYVQQLQALLIQEAEKRQTFYEQMTETQKAEFINGEIVLQSPVRLRHSKASEALYTLLNAFVAVRHLGYVGHEKILVSLTRNDYEPDICFFDQDKARSFTPDQMRFPAPDLVVEVLSPSTEEIDRLVKFEDYAAHGVAEYWLVDPEDEIVEQYLLHDGEYHLHIKSDSGIIRSSAIPGFSIPIRSIFDHEEQLVALRQIVAADSD